MHGSISRLHGTRIMLVVDGTGCTAARNFYGHRKKMAGDIYTGLSTDGKKETLITKGNYDVIDITVVDEKSGYVYFMASPTNATQKYLFRTKLDGGKEQRMTSVNQSGTHSYRYQSGCPFRFSHSFRIIILLMLRNC